jgi:hypothetical protein
MATPNLSGTQIAQISGLVANYIRTQRGVFAARAVELPQNLRVQMNGFFRADLLNSTRAVVFENERVGNPDFYPMLEGLGFRNLPDFQAMAAITFSDIIVSRERFTPTLLFHELVHVEQYRQLGIDPFAALYVKGFLTGGGYEGIPLERNAYGLEGIFRNAPHRAFSVEHEVATWMRKEGFRDYSRDHRLRQSVRETMTDQERCPIYPRYAESVLFPLSENGTR